MTRDVTFGKADTNGYSDSHDAPKEDVEELRGSKNSVKNSKRSV